MSENKPIYEFGEFRLNAAEGQLRRIGGEAVALSPKALDLLVCLVENHGRLLTKSEILDRVWADSFVEEGNLKINIHALRQILPREFIETVPKRGYRFAGEVRVAEVSINQNVSIQNVSVSQTAIPTVIDGQSVINQQTIVLTDEAAKTVADTLRAQVRKQVLVFLAIALLIVATVGTSLYLYNRRPAGAPAETKTAPVFSRSVAVLPFRNLTKDPRDEFLGIGLADALITRLGSVGKISVRPTGAVMAFAEDSTNQTISEQLQVDIILGGTLQRIGDRIRVAVQLVEMPSNRIVWASSFEESETDLLKIQDSISEQIVRSLEINLDQDERSIFARAETSSREAYRLYLQGRFHWNKRTKDDLAKSIDLLGRATRSDPNFALAHSALAEAYQLHAEYGGMDTAEAFAHSRRSALRALELNPNSAEAHNSLGYTLAFYDWNWPEAEREFRRALELNPNYPTARQWYGEYLIVFGRFDEARSQFDLALQLDPTSQIIAGDLAALLYTSGQYGQCLEHTAKALRRDAKSAYAIAFRWLCFEGKGEIGNAFEALQAGDALLFPPEIVDGQRRSWDSGGWQQVWRFKEEFFDKLPANQFVNNYTRAFTSLRAGNSEKAIEWLGKSFENRERWFVNLKHDPQFAPLRGDQRFADLVRKANLPSE